MKKLMKSSFALLLVLVITLTLLPAMQIGASAATSSDVNYVYSGNYIYNWGERGEVATFLSPNAEDFYTGINTYDVLSDYSGGTGKSDAPSSALYKALKKLMADNHTYINSYSANNNLLKYTDCQNSGGKISSFYSGTPIGPGWGEGGSWNKEHTWPNSKGLGGSDEDDIMMIRPTATSENSSRGNTAYGKSGGYYNPNGESGGKYDLRGDVARIFLYVYVRWGNTSYAWGTSGVMESVDVLLEWMEADPVDTWELGRNDSVESITGTRNVFVDYPEFAFLLFGEEIPSDMETPSGEGNRKCDHNNFNSGVVIAATCTAKGYTIFTCQTAGCGYSYKANLTNEKGHSYVNGACSACGEAEKLAPKALTEIRNGDVVIIGAPAYSMALSTEKVSTYYNKGVSYENGFDDITDSELFVVTVNSDGTYTFTSKTGDVIALAADYASLNADGQNKTWTLEPKSAGIFYVKNVGRGNYLEWYAEKNNWSTYNPGTLSDLFEISFYAANGGGSSSGGNTSCSHNYTSSVTAPTCTKGGYTTYTCSLCGDSYKGDEVAPTGHRSTNGVCNICGANTAVSGGKGKEIVFDFGENADATHKDGNEYTGTKDYTQDGYTLTISDLTKTYGPAYDAKGNSCIKIGTSKVVGGFSFTVPEDVVSVVINIAKYKANASKVSVNGTEYTLSKNSNDGEYDAITVDTSVTKTITLTTVSGGLRAMVNSISFIVEGGEHTHTEAIDPSVDATCTETGLTEGKYCAECGEILVAQEEVPALGHKDANEDGSCDRCGKTDKPSGGDTPGGSGSDTPDNPDNPGNGDIDDGEEETIWDIIMSFIQSIIDSIMEAISNLFN